MSRIVRMTRADSGTPWGFRLSGGRDFNAVLTVQKVSSGGMAQRNGVCVGDRVVSIGGDAAGHWTHQQAQQAVIRCGNELELDLISGGGGSGVTNHFYAPPSPVQHNHQQYSQPQHQNYNNHHQQYQAPPPSQHHYQPTAALYSPPEHQSAASWLPTNSAGGNSSPSPRQQPQQFNLSRYPTSPTGGSAPYSPPPPPPPPPQPSVHKPSVALSSRSRRGAAQRHQVQQAGSIPVCAGCSNVIRGPFLVALDKCFCPDHFNCCACGRNLEPCGFVEESGQLYCEDDYVRLLAPRCGGCHQTIVSESVHAMDQYFHRQCFVCAHCRKSIAGMKFRVEDDRPYCEKDWGDLFFTKCAKCHEAIAPIDRFVEVLGGTYHAQCFCCAVCGTCLEGKPFAPKDGKAYCKLHARRF